jgi:hypothetical protein
VREESPNGGAKWWLAGSEWAAVAYLSDGENGERKETSAGVLLFLGGGERGSGLGPTHRCRTADDLPVRRERDTTSLPYPGRTHAWRGLFEADPGYCSTGPDPIH